MKKNIVYIKSFFLLFTVVFLYGFTSHRNELRKVKDVTIEFTNPNNLLLSYEMVNKLLIQKNGQVVNQPKSSLNLHEFENSLIRNPFIEHAKVSVTIKGSIKALITQRTPIARVNAGSGVYYIDKQGVKVPLSANYSARVLLISGKIKSRDIPNLLVLIQQINSNEFLTNLIVGIQKNAANEYVLQTRVYDQYIYLGEISELNSKFKKLEAFYNEAIQEGEVELYKTINLKYNNQVVCTKD